VEYRNFDNEKVIESVVLPVEVYTQEEALKLGIVQPSKTLSYVISVIVIIVLIVVWRILKKRARMKRSLKGNGISKGGK